MKKTLIGAVLAALLAVPAANACTLEQLQQKALVYSQKVQEISQKDPQRLQRVAPRMEEVSKRFAEAANQRRPNYAEVCKLYDDIIAELGKS